MGTKVAGVEHLLVLFITETIVQISKYLKDKSIIYRGTRYLEYFRCQIKFYFENIKSISPFYKNISNLHDFFSINSQRS